MDAKEEKEVKEEKPQEKPEEPVEAKDTGDKPESTLLIDDTNLAAKRMEEATKAAREERIAAEESYAKMKLGGRAEAGGQAPKKEPETDEQYAERFKRGEVNPFKDDGVK